MVCDKCGGVLAEDSRFCTHCGAPIAVTPEPPVWDEQTIDAFIAQMPRKNSADEPQQPEREAAVPMQAEEQQTSEAESADPYEEEDGETCPEGEAEGRAPIYARDRAQKSEPFHPEPNPEPTVKPHYEPFRRNHSESMSTAEWLIVLLLSVIPGVNLVMLCIWAFTTHSDPVKRGYARAALILLAVLAGICVLAILAAVAYLAFAALAFF